MTKQARRARAPRMGAATRLVVGGILLVGVLFLGVFPTRTYLRQRREIGATEQQLAVLAKVNGKLRSQIHELRQPEEVERIARRQYNLTRPGEDLYLIIPSKAQALREASGADRATALIRSLWGFPGGGARPPAS